MPQSLLLKLFLLKNTPKKSAAVYSEKLFICQDFFAGEPQNTGITLSHYRRITERRKIRESRDHGASLNCIDYNYFIIRISGLLLEVTYAEIQSFSFFSYIFGHFAALR
jgi:hypothetical protein